MKKAYKDVTKEYNYKRKNYEEVTRNWLARKKVSTGKVIFRKYYVDKHGIKYKVDGKNVVVLKQTKKYFLRGIFLNTKNRG